MRSIKTYIIDNNIHTILNQIKNKSTYPVILIYYIIKKSDMNYIESTLINLRDNISARNKIMNIKTKSGFIKFLL